MKYSIVFFILGTSVSYVAVNHGGGWHILHWFAVTCFVLCAGYAGAGPAIFAKRADGTIPLYVKFIHLPYMLCATAIWWLAASLSRERSFDKVADDLILGRRVRAAEFPVGVINCVDLTSEFQEPKNIVQSTNYINLPILDADIPKADALVATISRLRPGLTYVHCAQGHGRTGLFAIALLAQRGRIRSFEDGVSLLKASRPGIRLNRRQERFIKAFLAEHVLASTDR